MPNLRNIRSKYISALTLLYGENEALSLFYWTVGEIMGTSRMDASSKLDETVEKQTADRLAEVLHRLEQGTPVQYVFNKAYFADFELYVDSRVLIPRPETEELYMWAVEELKGKANLRILDLCTGSGALAIALSKALPGAEVFACDISTDALEVAKKNESSCRCANSWMNPVCFFEYDVLSGEPLPVPVPAKFDLIISNPPYIRPSEKAQMRANVLDYEPGLALFVPENDPLIFYKSISELAGKYLVSGGLLMEEINEVFPDENRRILEKSGFSSVEIRADLQGKKRMIRGILLDC